MEPMPDRSRSTTTGREPETDLRELSKCKGQHKTAPHSDRGTKANTALVGWDTETEQLKNVRCPKCGSVMRFFKKNSHSRELLLACENEGCTHPVGFSEKKQDRTHQTPDAIRLRQLQKLGRR
jgi:hypothetical protein